MIEGKTKKSHYMGSDLSRKQYLNNVRTSSIKYDNNHIIQPCHRQNQLFMNVYSISQLPLISRNANTPMDDILTRLLSFLKHENILFLKTSFRERNGWWARSLFLSPPLCPCMIDCLVVDAAHDTVHQAFTMCLGETHPNTTRQNATRYELRQVAQETQNARAHVRPSGISQANVALCTDSVITI